MNRYIPAFLIPAFGSLIASGCGGAEVTPQQVHNASLVTPTPIHQQQAPSFNGITDVVEACGGIVVDADDDVVEAVSVLSIPSSSLRYDDKSKTNNLSCLRQTVDVQRICPSDSNSAFNGVNVDSNTLLLNCDTNGDGVQEPYQITFDGNFIAGAGNVPYVLKPSQ